MTQWDLMGDRGFYLFTFFDPDTLGRKKPIFPVFDHIFSKKIYCTFILHKLYYILNYVLMWGFLPKNTNLLVQHLDPDCVSAERDQKRK
jgi:hypothetical protein